MSYRDEAIYANPGLPPGVQDADLDGPRPGYRTTGVKDEEPDDYDYQPGELAAAFASQQAAMVRRMAAYRAGKGWAS
jgi:hypothetical protein